MAYLLEEFTQADGALSVGGWTDVGTQSAQVRSGKLSTVAAASGASTGQAIYKSHGLTGLIKGNTDWRVDVQVDTALNVGEGGVTLWFLNLATQNGLGIFVGNAGHIQRITAGVQTNLTNDARPGSGGGGHLASWITLTHAANGDMELLLDGAHLGSITDTTYAATTFDTIFVANYRTNASAFESTADNVLLADSLGLPFAYPPWDDLGDLFFDDFPDSAIDGSKWTVYDRLGDQVNSEVNAVIPENVRVTGGNLLIDQKFEDVVAGDTTTGAPNPRTVHYTSGQVAQATAPFLYGSVWVRAKMPEGVGNWPCIWMLGYLWQASQPYTANTPEHDWPNGGWWECDIAEFMHDHRTLQNCALHFITPSRGGSGEKSIPFDATTRFMVYRLDWAPTSLTWMVDAEDGVGWRELLTITGTAGTDVPDTAGYLIVHCAIGGQVAETPNPATFPTVMTVDWARIRRTVDTIEEEPTGAALGLRRGLNVPGFGMARARGRW